jgi:hypothetical protein
MKKMKKINLMIIMLMTILTMQSCSQKYGTLTGNVFWKYNEYVGNKSDAGSEVFLYSLDTTKNLKFEATADLQGNYKIERIPIGKYFLIIQSKNTKDNPIYLLQDLRVNKNEIKQIFKFDIDRYKEEIKDIKLEDSLALEKVRLSTTTLDDYGNYLKHKEQISNKASILLESFPDSFKRDIYLYSLNAAYEFYVITIEENKTENVITDFGTTYL